ncbi:MAG: cytochrome c biogenesis protein CcdA [Patescibacteria group bacterium]
MILLIAFAFIAGVVTILSPCILPILPIVLSGSLTGGKRKPLGIVTGFVGSFTFFTLFLSALVKAFHISPDVLRVFSIVVIFLFGLSIIIPKVQEYLEILFSKVSNALSPKQQKDGFLAGVVVGLSLGLLWTPCVGPILASVITLALTGSVTTTAFFITLSYSLGTALPMLLITYTGRGLFQKVPWLLSNTKRIQQGFGVIMMLTAFALMFNLDRKFQVWVLQTFPNYGTGLTTFEQNDAVRSQLQKLQPESSNSEIQNANGKPSFEMLSDLGKAPEFIPGGQWFNLADGKTSLSMKELRGKVVLVDFWTYSCINCIRTLPYLKDWNQKYADKGLVIVGVHSPEFEFEKNAKNVGQAIKDFGILYPVVQDNNFETWQAFGGNTWPRHYLIDKDGVIREFHSGEGKYAETEAAIQELIKAMGTDVSDVPINKQTYDINTQSPETYIGLARMEGLASPEEVKQDEAVNFTAPDRLRLNEFSLKGSWTVAEELASPATGSELQYHFKAQNVFLVMKPHTAGTSGKVEVYLDNQLLKTTLIPTDVDKNGTITIDQDRLYTLIKLDGAEEHTVKLKFLDNNVEVFAFTFG